MELVVDANILLSCFLKEGMTRALFLDDRLRLFSPEHLLFETKRHLRGDAPFRKRIRLEITELESLFEILALRVSVVPESSFKSFIEEALRLAAHPEDAPYLALALYLRIPLWSNDFGFKRQRKTVVYTTAELIRRLEI